MTPARLTEDHPHGKGHYVGGIDRSTIKHAIAISLITAFVLAAGFLGCNTVKGAGKDIEKGGQTVENTADKVQHAK